MYRSVMHFAEWFWSFSLLPFVTKQGGKTKHLLKNLHFLQKVRAGSLLRTVRLLTPLSHKMRAKTEVISENFSKYFYRHQKSRERTQNAFAPGEILGIIDTCNLWHNELTYGKLLEVPPMNPYLKSLQAYFKQNPPNHGDAESILGLLYWHYAENNPIDNQKIRDGFAQIRRQYSHLSMQEFDPIFTTVSDLCVEHERLAFYEGLRLGVTLMMELAEKETLLSIAERSR